MILHRPVCFLLLFFLTSLTVLGQSSISGDITGSVTDPSGGAVTNAKITLRNIKTGVVQTGATNTQGIYRFALIPSGTYSVTAELSGFQTVERDNVILNAGQSVAVDLRLSVAAATTTVDVSENVSSVQTENADLTTSYSQSDIQNMPNPGGDLTYIAQTAPGVVMNTQGGYGNFSAFGLPATSNLFTVNGQNFNDPYLNLNNSGASNLTLGFNDVAETNVVNNGYSAQYGQYAGSQVNYITKSGTNAFHGDALYFWNGRVMNADDFFSNSAGQPRPFVNFNQWATNVNGPIWKNHTFFDVDYEGYRVVTPSASSFIRVPSPAFQAATLANLSAVGRASEIPFYNQIFAIYNNAPNVASATPVTANNGGCGTFTAPGTSFGSGTPCALQYRSTSPNRGDEYQWAARVDHTFGPSDRAYIRLFRDNGSQPTYTDPLSAAFNAYSPQPQMSGQLTETHTFGSTAVNQINFSALFYSAAFLHSNAQAGLQALPTVVNFSGALFTNAGGTFYNFPQGRRVSQYELADDFSKIMGRHTVKVGLSYLRDNVTELGYGVLVNGELVVSSLAEFYSGISTRTSLTQRFPNATEQPLFYNTTGGYIADDWKATDRLNVSLNLRFENYGNPVCDHSCFARFNTTFSGNSTSADLPYNATIVAHARHAFPDTEGIVYEPRIGIAYRPFRNNSTVIRTGAGIFADQLPGVLARNATRNTPGLNSFTVRGGLLAPGVPNSLFAMAAQNNATLLNQFANGGTLASIRSVLPTFQPPNFTQFPAMFKSPRYYKWNFEIQQALPWNHVLSVNYVGTHGIHVPVADAGLNAYCAPSVCTGGFEGLPSAAPDPRFGTVTQYVSAGYSNYNGLTVSLQRRLASGLTYNLNYTWSHALDNVSNGGVLGLDANTDLSILNPQDPRNINRYNYGNADQDVRHYLSATFVLTDLVQTVSRTKHAGPWGAFGGWTLSANIFYRTGLPFTVIDSSATSALTNYTGNLFATPVTGSFATCDRSAVDTPCMNTAQFAASSSSPSGFGQQRRNAFRGPGFFDMDMALIKGIRIREKVQFEFGIQAYNLLNHPSFDKPVADIADPSFGTITGLATPPTGILGAFFGPAASPRFLEVKGTFRF